MTDKLELKSCHEVIDTVDVANIESIFYGGNPTDPDILTVVMKGGKRLYCDEVCPIDSLQEEPTSEGLDLDKEIETHLKECLDIKFPTTDIKMIAKDVEYTARKFFELGLKSRKENKL